jgi:hypothetical protein
MGEKEREKTWTNKEISNQSFPTGQFWRPPPAVEEMRAFLP